MRLSGLRFRWIYLLVIVTLAFVSKGDVPQQRVQLVQELAAGRITSYELQFTFTQSGMYFHRGRDPRVLGEAARRGCQGRGGFGYLPC